MIKYSASQARAHFNTILELAKSDAVEIEKHGKPAVVILDAVKYETLIDYIEDLEDKVAILEWERDPDKSTFTLEEVKKELGWG
jgi:prevent-host-death family protein